MGRIFGRFLLWMSALMVLAVPFIPHHHHHDGHVCVDMDYARQNADDSVCALSFQSLRAGAGKVVDKFGAVVAQPVPLLCCFVDYALLPSVYECLPYVFRPVSILFSSGFSLGWSFRGPPVSI